MDKERWLKIRGYELKHTEIGYWVDGACGFLVSGYYRKKWEAVDTAIERIKEAQKEQQWPTWRNK